MILLARSNYEIAFGPDEPISSGSSSHLHSQSNGIEDARFVRFQSGDEPAIYYATYTAYDGRTFLPQLLETEDFLHFKICTLNGPAVQNKGGDVPSKNSGSLLHAVSAGQREYSRNVFGARPLLVEFADHFAARGAMGVRSVGKLRFTD